MARHECGSCRECLTWVGVLGVHALLIALFVRDQHTRVTITDSETSTVLLFPQPPAPQLEPVSPKVATTQARSPRRPQPHRISAPAKTSTSRPTEAATATPPIDWHHEAELAAARHAPAAPGDHPGSASRACKMRPEARWEPEPKRAGFAGGLPYVRLGKRCVVGLGFFACALSPQAPPNGHVLDGVRNPNYDLLDGPDCAP
jgi:hypothetical protein